jgi:ABC-type Na+ transport system ATPase subunit NatA
LRVDERQVRHLLSIIGQVSIRKILSSKKIVFLLLKLFQMSKEEIKYEISKVLDHFSDKALTELLSFLKELDAKKEDEFSINTSLNRILTEDKELLAKLAQ